MPQWFYAHGDQQLGPVSEAEIKRLVAEGVVRPQDEVWCEGMPDWKQAGDVRELFRERPLVPPPPPARGAAGRSNVGAVPLQLLGINPVLIARPAGPWLVLAGFLLVILAKGCDAVGARHVARAQARAAQAATEFDYDYESRKLRLETQRDEINEKTTLTDYDRNRLDDIDKELAELEEDMQSDRRRLTRTTWRDLQHSAETAQASQQMWSYWNAIGFVFGSVVLTMGLIVTGVTGDTSQRWLSLAMLAIVAFSLFIGGFS
jgi:hypothetical protein